MNSESPLKQQNHWDKVLFILSCIYFFFVLSWLISQNKLGFFSINEKKQETNVNTLSQSDKQFIADLQAHLALIETKASNSQNIVAQNQQESVKIDSQILNKPINPPLPAPSPTQSRIIERVYIPLYPETPPVTQPTLPSSPPSLEMNDPSTENNSLSQPDPYHLRGTLAAGDRSYAIFEIDGKPQQIRMGEPIGQSGWRLIGVENQYITLAQAGKQRKMSVGDELSIR